MSDELDDIAVETVRERLRRDAAVEIDEGVMGRIKARADDGRVSVDAFAEWYDEGERYRDMIAERTDELESRVDRYRDSLDPSELEFDHVRARFDEYDDRLGGVRRDLETVNDRLETASRTPTSAAELYETTRLLASCGEIIHRLGHETEHLEAEVEEFESWLTDPAERLDQFGDELDTVEEYLDNTDTLLTNIETHAADPPEGFRPFDAWLTARHLHVLVAVVFEELRADADELDRWLEGVDGDHDAKLAALRSDLDALSERHEAFEGRIEAAADAIDGFEAAHAEVTDAIERFETELAALDPPVDWATLERRVDEQFDELGISHR